MQENTHTVLTVGMDGQRGFIVSIETVIRRGLFQFEIIGLANKTISESKQRILSALDYCLDERKQYINKKITTLLSPAGIKKEGSHFDLPIAVSYIISSIASAKSTQAETMEMILRFFKEVIIIGELTLTGSILPVPNVHKLIQETVKEGFRHFILPKGSRPEYVSEEISIWEISSISDIVGAANKAKGCSSKECIDDIKASVFESNKKTNADTTTNKKKDDANRNAKEYMIDAIKGNILLKRALEISLAGKHHALFIGEPGSGKSLIAKSARELIPRISIQDLNPIQLGKLLADDARSKREDRGSADRDTIEPPFRQPHHTSSYSEIIGNRHIEGEVALAHRGILFLNDVLQNINPE